MYKSESGIETAGGNRQPAFALRKCKAIIQNCIRWVDREPWLTCERRMPSAKPQPTIRHPSCVLSWEQHRNLTPGIPICVGSLRFEIADGVQAFRIGQPVPKSSNRLGCGRFLQLLACHSLLSFQ